jgi:hypothetical protein
MYFEPLRNSYLIECMAAPYNRSLKVLFLPIGQVLTHIMSIFYGRKYILIFHKNIQHVLVGIAVTPCA